jgi:hypothetical protein
MKLLGSGDSQRRTVTAPHEPAGVPQDRPPRWHYVRAATGRAGRLLVCTAILPAVPLAIFLAFYPKSASPTELLSHGDFAVLAAALTTAALAEIIGPAEPAKGLRNFLLLTGLSLYAFTVWLIAVIAGDAPQLSPARDAWLSVISCGIAALYAVSAWVATVEPPEPGKPRKPEGA